MTYPMLSIALAVATIVVLLIGRRSGGPVAPAGSLRTRRLFGLALLLAAGAVIAFYLSQSR